MAPKREREVAGTPTEFHLHVRFRSPGATVIDYSEFRLRRYIDIVKEKGKLGQLQRLLVDYLAGKIMIAWKDGKPTYTNAPATSSD